MKGEDLLQVYQSNRLRIMNTFFNAPTHVTYFSFNNERTQCMLDMASVNEQLFRRILDCKVVSDGIRSDHSAVKLVMQQYSIEYVPREVHRGQIDKHALQYDEQTNIAYNDYILSKSDLDTPYDDYCDLLVEAAKATASRPIAFNKSIFDFNKDILLEAMDTRNRLLHATRHLNLPPDELERTKCELRQMQKTHL